MDHKQPKNTFNHLPIFDNDSDTLDHERESIAVYDLTSKQMIAYNLASGWVEFTTKKPIENVQDIEWVYIEEMATPYEESDESTSDGDSDVNANNVNNDVIVPELINP